MINIPPSNIFLTMPLPARFHQNCQAVFAAVSINGLIHKLRESYFRCIRYSAITQGLKLH